MACIQARCRTYECFQVTDLEAFESLKCNVFFELVRYPFSITNVGDWPRKMALVRALRFTRFELDL